MQKRNGDDGKADRRRSSSSIQGVAVRNGRRAAVANHVVTGCPGAFNGVVVDGVPPNCPAGTARHGTGVVDMVCSGFSRFAIWKDSCVCIAACAKRWREPWLTGAKAGCRKTGAMSGACLTRHGTKVENASWVPNEAVCAGVASRASETHRARATSVAFVASSGSAAGVWVARIVDANLLQGAEVFVKTAATDSAATITTTLFAGTVRLTSADVDVRAAISVLDAVGFTGTTIRSDFTTTTSTRGCRQGLFTSP